MVYVVSVAERDDEALFEGVETLRNGALARQSLLQPVQDVLEVLCWK